MLEHYLDQLGDMLHLCADTDGTFSSVNKALLNTTACPCPPITHTRTP